MKIVTATPKPKPGIEAVMFDTESVVDIADWLHSYKFEVKIQFGQAEALFELFGNRELKATEGYWIVKDPWGPIRCMSDDIFREAFENIEEF